MPASAFLPEISVEVAFTTAPEAAAPAWQDITDWVAGEKDLVITRGRSGEYSSVAPSRLQLQLDNRDGRFTPGRVGSPYYPNVKRGRKIRVRARWPLGQAGNMVTNPGAEVDTATFAGVNAALARTTTAGQFRSGVAAYRLTVTAGATVTELRGAQATDLIQQVVGGRAYTFSFYVKAGTTARQVRARLAWFKVDGVTPASTATVDSADVATSLAAFTRVTLTATAPDDAAFVSLRPMLTAAQSVAADVWFFDDLMFDEGAAAGVFTTSPPPITTRFTGFVDQWPTSWAGGTDADAEVLLTATGRFGRMGRKDPLRSVVEEEILSDGPAYYWTLGDASGATSAGPAAGLDNLSVGQMGVGGEVVFGSATGPDTDGLTAAQFVPVDAGNGQFLWAPLSTPIPASSDYSIEVFYLTAAAGTFPTLMVLAAGADAPTNSNIFDSITVSMDSTGHLRMSGQIGGVSIPAVTTDAGATNDGETHPVMLTFVQATGVYNLYRGGVLVGTLTDATAHPAWGRVILGGAVNGAAAAATYAHVAVHATALSAARALAHAQAGSTGFTGERTDERISRLARHAGIPAGDVLAEVGLSTVALQQTGGMAPLAAMQQVEAVEAGLLFETGDGKIGFHARSHRYNASSVLTLDATLQHVGADLTFAYDDQGLVNDLTHSRPNGPTARIVNQLSIDDNGTYGETVSLPFANDNDMRDAANLRVQKYGQPSPRPPQITVDAHNIDTMLTALLAGELLGDLITLTGLPAQAPVPSLDLFIEGVTETIGARRYAFAFNTSPGSRSDVWVLDSATRSQLDSTTVLAY